MFRNKSLEWIRRF